MHERYDVHLSLADGFAVLAHCLVFNRSTSICLLQFPSGAGPLYNNLGSLRRPSSVLLWNRLSTMEYYTLCYFFSQERSPPFFTRLVAVQCKEQNHDTESSTDRTVVHHGTLARNVFLRAIRCKQSMYMT